MMKSIPIQIGLTGGIGCGKSAVAKEFELLGIPVIDSDQLAHQVTSPNGLAMDKILTMFGKEFVNADGSLNRQAMRDKVFHDPQALKKLESITHPLIRKLSDEKFQEYCEKNPPYVIQMIPLLFESKDWKSRFKKVILVDCSEFLQISRVLQRPGMTEAIVKRIICTQIRREDRLKLADYIISNEGPIEELQAKVLKVHLAILALQSPLD